MTSHDSRNNVSPTSRIEVPKGPLVWRRLWILGLLELSYVIYHVLLAMAGREDLDTDTLGFVFWTAIGSFAISWLVFFWRKDAESGGEWSRMVSVLWMVTGSAYLGYKFSIGVARHLHHEITRD